MKFKIFRDPKEVGTQNMLDENMLSRIVSNIISGETNRYTFKFAKDGFSDKEGVVTIQLKEKDVVLITDVESNAETVVEIDPDFYDVYNSGEVVEKLLELYQKTDALKMLKKDNYFKDLATFVKEGNHFFSSYNSDLYLKPSPEMFEYIATHIPHPNLISVFKDQVEDQFLLEIPFAYDKEMYNNMRENRGNRSMIEDEDQEIETKIKPSL